MKNTIILLLLCTLFINCKSVLYNSHLNRIGIYNDIINLQRITKKDQQIVFFPIAHLDIKLFYKDVKNKIDSLKNEGYYFYYEKLNLDVKRDLQVVQKQVGGMTVGLGVHALV